MDFTTASTFVTINTTTWDSYDNQTDAPVGVADGPGWVLPEWIATVRILVRIRLGIALVAVFCNAVVLLFQLKLRSFQKTPYFFAVTLVLSDLVFSVCLVGDNFSYIFGRGSLPAVYSVAYEASNLVDWFSVIAIGVDRYLALVKMPLTYKFDITIKKYVVVVTVLVIVGVLYGLISLYVSTEAKLTHVSSVLAVSLIVSTFIYVATAVSIRRSLRATKLGDRIQKIRLKQTRKILFAFALILITNFICFAPSSVAALVIYIHNGYLDVLLRKDVLILNVLFNVRALNLICNPIIYWRQILLREISFSCRSTGNRSTESTVKTVSKTTASTNHPDEAQRCSICPVA